MYLVDDSMLWERICMFITCVCFKETGPVTCPIGLDSKRNCILMYLYIRSSDVLFYGHRIYCGGFFGQPSGENTFSKNAPNNKSLLCSVFEVFSGCQPGYFIYFAHILIIIFSGTPSRSLQHMIDGRIRNYLLGVCQTSEKHMALKHVPFVSSNVT